MLCLFIFSMVQCRLTLRSLWCLSVSASPQSTLVSTWLALCLALLLSSSLLTGWSDIDVVQLPGSVTSSPTRLRWWGQWNSHLLQWSSMLAQGCVLSPTHPSLFTHDCSAMHNVVMVSVYHWRFWRTGHSPLCVKGSLAFTYPQTSPGLRKPPTW